MQHDKFYPDTQASYNPQQYHQNIPNQSNISQNIPNMAAQYAKPMEPTPPVAITRTPEPEKPKPPIPEQHMHLKTVFDELKNQCFENAKNPVR